MKSIGTVIECNGKFGVILDATGAEIDFLDKDVCSERLAVNDIVEYRIEDVGMEILLARHVRKQSEIKAHEITLEKVIELNNNDPSVMSLMQKLKAQRDK
jgi:hypothetical protein